MKIYDQHVHTLLSSDSEEAMESYLHLALEKGVTHFVSTEHVDLSPHYQPTDDIPDFIQLERLLHMLQKQYPLQLLKGIELGYKRSRLPDFQRIIGKENFDMIIMSVHESEQARCVSDPFLRSKTPDEAYEAYIDLYLEMLTTFHDYDIVGHIDFLLRYIGTVTIEKHEKKLRALLQLVIAQGKSLEFNTRFLYQQNNSAYLTYLFSLYYACGGRKVSLGSDAHTAQVFMGAFDEAQELLKSLGFTHISVFQKRKELLLPL